MSLPYFPLYPAAFMGGVRGMTPQEVGVYIMLLCRMYEENGPIEYHVLRLSTYCGMREKTFQMVTEKLVALGKLSLSDGMLFNDKAASVISDRSDKLKNNSKAGKRSAEKRQQNQSSAATDVQQAFNHLDRDRDIDKKKDLADKPPPKKRACQIPKDWVPSEQNVSDAEAKGFSGMEIGNEAGRFRDYHTAKGSTFKCWDAAWRTWLGNAAKFGATRAANSAGMARGTTASEIADRGARWAASRAAGGGTGGYP